MIHRAKLFGMAAVLIILEIVILVLLWSDGQIVSHARHDINDDGGWVDIGRQEDPPPVQIAPERSLPKDDLLPVFYKVALAKGRDISLICPQSDTLNRVILAAYGAIYVSRPDLLVPESCLADAAQIDKLQKQAGFRQAYISKVRVSLQKPALEAFFAANTEAQSRGLRITPKGSRASARNYADTKEIWYRNLELGIRSAHAITNLEVMRLRSQDIKTSVAVVLEVERRGILLGSAGGKSIIQIAAPTGASQHIAGLAIDIEEHANPQVRDIMEKHGFFQTVINDFTHFTFLGYSRQELAALGLIKKISGGRTFFVPKLS